MCQRPFLKLFNHMFFQQFNKALLTYGRCSNTFNQMRSAVSENTLPEEVMISVKTLYVLCLFFVFSYSITKSVLHFLEEPTSFEENELEYSSTFPSLTLCFRQFEPDNFSTFQEIMQNFFF